MTRYLLDTHVAIWWSEDSPRLSVAQRAIIGEGSNEVYLSVVSVWEAAIKSANKRLFLPREPLGFFQSLVEQSGLNVLPVHLSHAAAVHSLPKVHNDPFDRLLICQARGERMTLLSSDQVFESYDLPGLVQ